MERSVLCHRDNPRRSEMPDLEPTTAAIRSRISIGGEEQKESEGKICCEGEGLSNKGASSRPFLAQASRRPLSRLLPPTLASLNPVCGPRLATGIIASTARGTAGAGING